MTVVVPRWEWRTFGDRFGRAEAVFGALTQTGVQESDELYLLSASDATVKVRDELVDIKVLRETDDGGLQRWEPVVKAPFPLPPEGAAAVADALGIAPLPIREAWTLDALMAEVAAPGSGVRAVPVQKRRVRYAIGGCTSEVTDVTIGGSVTRTIAIESEDAAAVSAAVRSAGLGGYRNVSYPLGLARLVDGVPARYAVIDVGTNSIKLHLAEVGPGGGWRTVVDRAEVTRLGEGVAERGLISEEAVNRAVAAISGMVDEAAEAAALATIAVGTAGLRMAANGSDVVAAIRARCRLDVEVIPGDEESRLAYLAVVSALPVASGASVVFDTGGGSSQFTFGHDGTIDERFSVDVGAARYTERFGLDSAVSAEAVAAACAAISDDLVRLDGRPRPDAVVGMGGAITNLTAVRLGLATYDPVAVQGARLDQAEIERQIERYRTSGAAERRAIVGLQPKRAEVILAGACIVLTVLRKLGHSSLTVSDRGLRHGVLLERFGACRSLTGTTGDVGGKRR